MKERGTNDIRRRAVVGSGNRKACLLMDSFNTVDDGPFAFIWAENREREVGCFTIPRCLIIGKTSLTASLSHAAFSESFQRDRERCA